MNTIFCLLTSLWAEKKECVPAHLVLGINPHPQMVLQERIITHYASCILHLHLNKNIYIFYPDFARLENQTIHHRQVTRLPKKKKTQQQQQRKATRAVYLNPEAEPGTRTVCDRVAAIKTLNKNPAQRMKTGWHITLLAQMLAQVPLGRNSH